jgi:hypothetical protein
MATDTVPDWDFDEEEKVKAAWQRTVSRSPLVANLKKAADLQLKFFINIEEVAYKNLYAIVEAARLLRQKYF